MYSHEDVETADEHSVPDREAIQARVSYPAIWSRHIKYPLSFFNLKTSTNPFFLYVEALNLFPSRGWDATQRFGGKGLEGKGKACYLMINQTHGTRETTKADLMLDFSLLKKNILKNT